MWRLSAEARWHPFDTRSLVPWFGLEAGVASARDSMVYHGVPGRDRESVSQLAPLAAIGAEQERSRSLRAAAAAQESALEMAQSLYRRGLTDFLRIETNGRGEPPKITSEEVVMEKSKLIEKLVANSNCPFDKTDLESMSEAALVKLEKKLEGGCSQTQAAESAPAANEAAAKTPELPAELAELKALASEISSMGGVAVLKQAISQVNAAGDEQKAALVGELKANERCAFGEEDLKAMSLDTLRKLASSLKPANYAGRGAPRANITDGQSKVPAAPAILLAKVAPEGQEK